MKKIITIGELLIDFIPNEKGVGLNKVNSFTKFAGGAPANVAAAAVKHFDNTFFLGQVGNDSFGLFLEESLEKQNVKTNYLFKTSKANTSLAFVTLDSSGERDFIFYRNPGADQLLDSSILDDKMFENTLLHFCSVSLDDYPTKDSHIKAIESVIKQNGFISFDPNLRLSLWNDHDKYKERINEFIPYADLLKVSNDEIKFITGEKDINKGINKLFKGRVKYIILTRGSLGSKFYSKDFIIEESSFKVDVIDTTGAGDSFIGTFLGQLISNNMSLKEEDVRTYLKTSNATAALVTTKYGGMTSIPEKEEVKKFINKN